MGKAMTEPETFTNRQFYELEEIGYQAWILIEHSDWTKQSEEWRFLAAGWRQEWIDHVVMRRPGFDVFLPYMGRKDFDANGKPIEGGEND